MGSPALKLARVPTQGGMKLKFDVELSHDELTALAQSAGVSFLSGHAIVDELRSIIHRELSPGVDLGILYRVTYYREDKDQPYGFKLFTHVMQGPYWPHVRGRPRFYWDGRQLRTRGGAFTVDASRGILDQRPVAGEPPCSSK